MADLGCMVTIVASETGKSETLTVSLKKTTVKELSEWCVALMGMRPNLRILKDGNPLIDPTLTLEQANIQNGDLLALAKENPISRLPTIAKKDKITREGRIENGCS